MGGKGKPFAKGNSGGPGAPRVPEEIKAARRLGRATLEGLIHKYLMGTEKDITNTLKDPMSSATDKLICQIISRSLSDGDYRNLDFLLNRIIGKVKDTVEHIMPKPTIIVRQNGDEIELGHEVKTIEEEI